jgi:hypothetical protein
MKRFCIILFSCFILTSANPVVILVHGTFAKEEDWYRPGGDFYKELEKRAFLKKHHLVSFMWSGRLNDKARVKGAESLAKLIVSYPKEEEVILVGHSHGGNVINFASKLLFDPFENIDADEKEILDFLDEHFSSLDLIESYAQTRSFVSVKERAINAWLAIRKTKTVLNSVRFFWNKKEKKNKKYKIDEAYLLATPVDTVTYAPDMEVIKNVYNLFSFGDKIQRIGRMYKRFYPKQDRLFNIRLKIREFGNPSHEQMHNPVIAKHLFEIGDLFFN